MHRINVAYIYKFVYAFKQTNKCRRQGYECVNEDRCDANNNAILHNLLCCKFYKGKKRTINKVKVKLE